MTLSEISAAYEYLERTWWLSMTHEQYLAQSRFLFEELKRARMPR